MPLDSLRDGVKEQLRSGTDEERRGERGIGGEAPAEGGMRGGAGWTVTQSSEWKMSFVVLACGWDSCRWSALLPITSEKELGSCSQISGV